MPKRDPLAAGIAATELVRPPAQPAPFDFSDDPNAPLHLVILDDIWRNPEPEDAKALPVLDGLMLLLVTTPWAGLSDTNHDSLLASIEYTVRTPLPGFKEPTVCGSIPETWGLIGGSAMARATEHLATADRQGFSDPRQQQRAEDIRALWIRQQRFRPGEHSLTWALRALMPYLEQATAEADSWPEDRRRAAEARVEELR